MLLRTAVGALSGLVELLQLLSMIMEWGLLALLLLLLLLLWMWVWM
jgi:hypothetical protein